MEVRYPLLLPLAKVCPLARAEKGRAMMMGRDSVEAITTGKMETEMAMVNLMGSQVPH